MTNDNLTRRDFAFPVVAGLDAARASRLARFAATDRKDIRVLQANLPLCRPGCSFLHRTI